MARSGNKRIQQNTTCISKTNSQTKPSAKETGKQSDYQTIKEAVPSNSAFCFLGAERIHYLEGLVSKQLELYTWCEEKVTTLATIDAILLAGATLFIEHIKSGIFPKRVADTFLNNILMSIEQNFVVLTLLFILFPIFVSLGIALFHVIPKMSSGASPSTARNHRSSRGIHSYKDIQEYKNRMDSISADDIYIDLLRQIYGMNINIWRNQFSIKVAVYCDLVGLLGFICIMLYMIFNGNFSTII